MKKYDQLCFLSKGKNIKYLFNIVQNNGRFFGYNDKKCVDKIKILTYNVMYIWFKRRECCEQRSH